MPNEHVSAELEARLSKYPIKKIPSSDGRRTVEVRYDAQTGRVWELDANQRPTGRYGTVQKNLFSEEPSAEATASTKESEEIPSSGSENLTADAGNEYDDEDRSDIPVDETTGEVIGDIPPELLKAIEEANEQENTDEAKENDSEQQQGHTQLPQLNKKAITAAIVLGIILVILFPFMKAARIVHENTQTETTAPAQISTTSIPDITDQQNTEAPSKTEPETSAASYINVLSLKNNKIPGDTIRERDLEVTKLTESEYRMISSSKGIYKEEELSNLIGMEAIIYIPSGTLLGYNDVSFDYAPENPWLNSNTSIVTIPVVVDSDSWPDYLWGSNITLQFELVQKYIPPTDNTSDTGSENTETQSGSTITQSTITNTYELRDVLVVDVLDYKQDSLFDKYSAYAAVPAVYMEEVLTNKVVYDWDKKELEIKFIRVAVDPEHEELIGWILNERCISRTVTATKNGMAAQSQLQADQYAALQNAGKYIGEFISREE